MRGTREINWGTPKQIQMKKEHINEGRHYKNRKKMPKNVCKKNHGGPHDYIWEDRGAHFLGWYWTEARCRFCGKKNFDLTYSDCKLFQ